MEYNMFFDCNYVLKILLTALCIKVPLTFLQLRWHGVRKTVVMNFILHLKIGLMKQILSIVTIAAVMAACNTSPRTEDTTKNVSYSDTVGLAKFQEWKAQNELSSFNEYNKATQPNTQPAKKTTKSSNPVRKANTSKSRSVNETGNISSESQNTAKKKGWSKAAKGTVIGAGTGAVIGGVVNKRNRAVGAIIGGVAGGAVGYGVGRSKDKKDGRY